MSAEFSVSFDTTNAAFMETDGGANPGPEIAAILRRIADKCEREGEVINWSGAAVDSNGNVVGSFRLEH